MYCKFHSEFQLLWQQNLGGNKFDSPAFIKITICFILFYSPEPYTPTGNFEVDFCELCTRAGFPLLQVVPRPKRPATPSPVPQNITPTLSKADKKEGSHTLTLSSLGGGGVGIHPPEGILE